MIQLIRPSLHSFQKHSDILWMDGLKMHGNGIDIIRDGLEMDLYRHVLFIRSRGCS